MIKEKRGIKNVFHSSGSNAYCAIEEICIRSLSSEGKRQLDTDNRKFDDAFSALEAEINSFQKKVNAISLASLVVKWARTMATDAVYGKRYIRLMCDLIESGLMQLSHNRNEPHTPSTFGLEEHQRVISAIRNHESWSIPKREEYVCFYIEFSNWLSEVTFGYIPPARDQDRHLSARRKFPFDAYIKLLNELNLRERILAKFFYLGGERSFDEILSLKIADLDFTNHCVTFIDHKVEYPEHLFHDISKYLEGRSRGYLFVGRGGEKINHTVPYRALKAVADKLNLGSSFSFKDLVRES